MPAARYLHAIGRRLNCATRQRPRHPSRLVIESHGRACEVGRFLTEEERIGLAGRLRQLVGKSSESPALEARS